MPQRIQLGPAFTPPVKKVAGSTPAPRPAPLPVLVLRPTPPLFVPAQRTPALRPTPPLPVIKKKPPIPKARLGAGLLRLISAGESKINPFSGTERTIKRTEDARDIVEGGAAVGAIANRYFSRYAGQALQAFKTSGPAAGRAVAAVTPYAARAASVGGFAARRMPVLSAGLVGVDAARMVGSPQYREEARKSVDNFAPAKHFSVDAARQALDRPSATIYGLARATGETLPGPMAAKQSQADAEYNLKKQQMKTRLRLLDVP